MAACNDTNCPDLNAVIGPLGAPVRKWLQLRLFHFLATEAQALQFEKRVCGGKVGGGGCFALPVPRSSKRSLMMAKLYELSRLQGEGSRRQQTKKVEACVGQKGFFFFLIPRLGICLDAPSGRTGGETNGGLSRTEGGRRQRGRRWWCWRSWCFDHTSKHQSPIFNSGPWGLAFRKTDSGLIILAKAVFMMCYKPPGCQMVTVHRLTK